MNSQTLQDLIIAPQSGSGRHQLLKQYEAIKNENGDSYGYSYWAKVEKYDYRIVTSNIIIKDLEIYYNVSNNNYYFKGRASFTSDTVAIVHSGYYYDTEGTKYIDDAWTTYKDESFKFLLYVNNYLAIDFGTMRDSASGLFDVRVGDVKPNTAIFELRGSGNIESTKKDINLRDFSIEIGDVIATGSLLIPDFTVVPNTVELNNILIDKRILEKSYTNIVDNKEWTWNYRIEFNEFLYENLVINFDEEDENYYLTGNFTTSYNKKTEESCWWDKDNHIRSGYNNIWDTYDDTGCRIGIYINNNIIIDLGAILTSKIVTSQAFSYNLGKTVLSDFVITTKITGTVQSQNNDAEGNLFSLNTNDSVVAFSKILMPFTISNRTASAIPDSPDTIKPPTILQDTIFPTEEYIEKKIGVFDGWRYLIGIRDIDIRNRKYTDTSEIVTKKFQTTKPIKKILLYSNEIIPEQFLEAGLEMRNDWIKYYISINDTDWYRISPMHHNQVGDLEISPKIYEINSRDSIEERINTINKGYILSTVPIDFVRLKIILTRPEGMDALTPIIEEYALKCVMEGAASE